jgi:hypothetical protein
MPELLVPCSGLFSPVVMMDPAVSRSVMPTSAYVSVPNPSACAVLTSKKYGSMRMCPRGSVFGDAASIGPVNHASSSDWSTCDESAGCWAGEESGTRRTMSPNIASRVRPFGTVRTCLLAPEWRSVAGLVCQSAPLISPACCGVVQTREISSVERDQSIMMRTRKCTGTKGAFGTSCSRVRADGTK